MVVSFRETFQSANTANIDGYNGWKLVAGGANIGINNTAATAQETESVAFQETTVPATKDQWIRAVVSSAIETESGVQPLIYIGTMAQRGTNDYGFGVRLQYAASGVRTLDLIEGLGSGVNNLQSIGDAATVTSSMVTVGGTDLGVPQTLYFAVTTVRGGVLLRGAVNNEDLNEPDVELLLGKDLPIGIGTSPDDFGDWYFAFGLGATSGQLRVYEFEAMDELEALTLEAGIQIQNTLTRSELRTRVQNRFNKSSNSNLSDTVINEEINSVVAEVWQEGVDIWTFNEPTTTISITRDTNGMWTAPYYMESILRVWRTDVKHAAAGHEWGRDQDDRIIFKFHRILEPSTLTAQVTYRQRTPRMDADGDPCMIPRQYSDIVELGVLRNLARDDTVRGRFEAYENRFQKRLMDMKRMENHKRWQRKRRMAALRTSGRIPGQLVPFSTGYTGI